MLCFVLGTRPEIVKLAPVIRRCARRGIPFQIIHTQQHYDYAMDGVFFEQLRLPQPHVQLRVGDHNAPEMLAQILRGCEAAWVRECPALVAVQGDTNSTFGGAFTANKIGISVAHVEAGLRSDDLSMPEEINRILTDHIADRLYAPTSHQRERLLREGLGSRHLLVTGNTILDAVREHLPSAATVDLPSPLRDLPPRIAIITLHRPSLVDEPTLLSALLLSIDTALAEHGLVGVFLAHPRTRRTLRELRLRLASIRIDEPVGYLSMLHLLSRAACVLTDSGGLQEEAAILHVPCLTLRTSTERPETIDAGGNVVVAPSDPTLSITLRRMLTVPVDWKPLYAVECPSDVIVADLLSALS